MKARVEWDGYKWVAIPEVGGTTQAKRLDQLPARIVEVVELMTGKVIDPAMVVLDIDFPGADEAAELRVQREHIAAAELELSARTRRCVLQLRKRGVTMRDAAAMVGLSYQRVHQLVQD